MINVYVDKGINIDDPICQYMKWDYFKALLDNNRYSVKRKKEFDDEQERHLPFIETLPFNLAGKERDEEQWEKHKKLVEEYEECGNLPTACWSYDILEKEWKWKQYASKDGVCIISSIRKLMNSLSSSKYEIQCGKINYAKYRPYKELGKQLFTKDRMYRDDCEMRLYFTLNNPTTDIDTSNPSEEKRIEIDVNPREMIDYVIMSPFTDITTMKERRSYLENKGITIKSHLR